MSTQPHFSLLATSFAGGPRPRNAALILAGLWLAIFFAALFAPPILDDADATHAQAARAMATTGDLVTLRVDGVRYLEKAPLPYWLAALSFRIFGFNTFAAHLPQALAVALLALLGHRWANQAFGSRTAFYTAIALLTSLGTFLFTRILIPEALLSLFLAAALFAFLKSLGPISSPSEGAAEYPILSGSGTGGVSSEARPSSLHLLTIPSDTSAPPSLTPARLVSGVIFGSPQEGMIGLEEAIERTGQSDAERFIAVARDIEHQHGSLMTHFHATGIWSGGAEPSVISGSEDLLPETTLFAIAALRGRAAGQDAMLVWHDDEDGPHVYYVVDLRRSELKRAAIRVLEAGLENATVSQADDRTYIHVILLDSEPKTRVTLERKLNEHFSDGIIHDQPGYGQLLRRQASSTDQSQWTYDQVIARYSGGLGNSSLGPRSHRDDLSVSLATHERHLDERSPFFGTTPERPALIPSVAPLYPYLMWGFLALAVLTKGLVALVFFVATTLLYLLLLGELKTSLPKLKLLPGGALFLAIAAPWHILAALRNPGFLRFYFWNEHVLRFLGTRTPADFNRLPGYLYWSLHLVWLFPWSLFFPLGLAALYRRYIHQVKFLTGQLARPRFLSSTTLAIWAALIVPLWLKERMHLDLFAYFVLAVVIVYIVEITNRRRLSQLPPSPFHRIDPQQRTILLLSLFAAIVLLFFSLSTNQEYYTFPAYLPLLLLFAATVTRAEQTYSSSPEAQRWMTVAHAAFTFIGTAAALTLLYGLWTSRHLPYTADIGTLLARRNVAANTLSLSHLFDLTTDAFAALRLPAALAALALLFGPPLAWLLRTQRRHIAATTAIAFTFAAFLIAAHLAFARFAPVLSSRNFTTTIRLLEHTHRVTNRTPIYLFGDQALGSSIPFYLGHLVLLVDGRTTSMQFGSAFPDAPNLFLSPSDLQQDWAGPDRVLLFVPAERREEALRLLPPNPIILRDESGKLLLTNHHLK